MCIILNAFSLLILGNSLLGFLPFLPTDLVGMATLSDILYKDIEIGMRCLDDLFGSDYRIDCDASDRLDSRMIVFSHVIVKMSSNKS